MRSLRSFNLGSAGSGDQCVGALAAQDMGLGDNVWLLGDRCVSPVESSQRLGLTPIYGAVS